MFFTNSEEARKVLYMHIVVHPLNYDGKINFTIHMFYVTLMPFTNTKVPFGMKLICDNEIDLLTFLLLEETINFAYVTKLFVLCEYVS